MLDPLLEAFMQLVSVVVRWIVDFMKVVEASAIPVGISLFLIFLGNLPNILRWLWGKVWNRWDNWIQEKWERPANAKSPLP